MSTEDKKIEAPIEVIGESKKDDTEELLKEFKLSWAGKMFFAAVAAYILGNNIDKIASPVKVKGNPEQMKALVDAIISSKRFQQELNKPGATVDKVIEKLQLRNMSKENFQSLTGKKWPI